MEVSNNDRIVELNSYVVYLRDKLAPVCPGTDIGTDLRKSLDWQYILALE